MVLVRAPRRDPRARTTRRSARSAPHPSSAAWCATGTPSASPTLAVAIGSELGFSRHELEQLETAALLHHLGQVCLDEPERRPPAGAGLRWRRRARRSSAARQLLAPAGDIIAAEAMPYRDEVGVATVGDVRADPEGRERVRRAVATVDADRAGLALEALYSAPEYLYDARVLGALEIVLDRARPARADHAVAG